MIPCPTRSAKHIITLIWTLLLAGIWFAVWLVVIPWPLIGSNSTLVSRLTKREQLIEAAHTPAKKVSVPNAASNPATELCVACECKGRSGVKIDRMPVGVSDAERNHRGVMAD